MLEVLIVGGGTAGLSAALVLGRCVRRVLVVDSGRYRNERSRALHCYVSRDGIAPKDLLATSREQLARYGCVSYRQGKVSRIVQEGASFIATIDDEDVSARAVLIATGVVDQLPPIAGIEEFFGQSVHVCPFCDGWEHRDAAVAVYGKGPKSARLALLLRQWTDDLVLCTDGPRELHPEDERLLEMRGIQVCETSIVRLEGKNGCLEAICFADNTQIKRQALFFQTGQHPRSTLLERLGCDFGEDGVAVDQDGATSIPGIYVAGDVSRDVQLAIIASAEGARAALAINSWLMKSDGYLPEP